MSDTFQIPTPPSSIDPNFGQWEEWHYRHEFFWSASIRWVIAILATAALPYSSESVRSSFGLWSVVFPVFACILGAVAFFHLLAEHARALYVRWNVGYRERDDEFLNDRRGTRVSYAQVWLRKPIRWRIGPYIFASLSFAFFCLNGLNLLFFQQFLSRDIRIPTDPIATAVLKWFGIAWIVGGGIAAAAVILADQRHYQAAPAGEQNPARSEA